MIDISGSPLLNHDLKLTLKYTFLFVYLLTVKVIYKEIQNKVLYMIT